MNVASNSLLGLQSITGGELKGPNLSHLFQFLSYDSRHITDPANTLFVALKGERLNGSQFVAEAYEKGVRLFLVQNPFQDYQDFLEASFLLVPDSLIALQAWAAAHRRDFSIPVIGVIGSNGKTIVKEWLAELLESKYQVVKSPRSYNSQLGVSLSCLLIDEEDTLGIFEAGISKIGEMNHLEQMIQPNIGIFTYLGTAHSSGFESQEQKLLEKLQLFKGCDKIIYCRDQELVHQWMTKLFGAKAIGFSTNSAGSYHFSLQIQKHKTLILFSQSGESFTIETTFRDEASLNNVCTCITLLCEMDALDTDTINALTNLKPIDMRLIVKEGLNECLIVDDSYNADETGLELALRFLEQQSQKMLHTVILSDLVESDKDKKALYQRIASSLDKHNISKVMTVGQESKLVGNYLNPKILYRHFPNTQEFLTHFQHSDFRKEAILVKGARKYEFELIVQALSKQTHRTILEVNLTALLDNFKTYASMLRPEVKIMAMVKASAYGAGSDEVAKLLQHHKVDYLCVAYPDEGLLLRNNGIHLPILVLNPDEQSFSLMVSHQLEAEVYSLEMLEKIIAFCQPGTESINIHLKLDTGMNRLGFKEEDLPSLIGQLGKMQGIIVKSMFSHLASSEDPLEDDYTKEQVRLFDLWSTQLEDALGYKVLKHVLNSSGISRFCQYQYDMVRLGIGLYGYDSYREMSMRLRPVHCFKARISQIKNLESGTTVGYGRRGIMKSDGRIATISVGYADGFLRGLGNGNYRVGIRNKLAPTIGNVCMDMAMVDVSDIPEASTGDEVILFGEYIPVTDMSEALGTIPYEVFTGISSRVKRVYYQE